MFTPRSDEDLFHFILRWIARISSLVIFAILLLFYVSDSPDLSSLNTKEMIGMVFFPVGLLLGFAWSWHSELPGGLLSIVSTAAFYVVYGLILNGSLDQGVAFLVFTMPAFLFAAYGLIVGTRIGIHGRNTASGH
jgi:hypothetical protein